MFLQQLMGNISMKESIRRCAERGMPIYAECGGLMYLCKAIQGFNGECYEWWELCRLFVNAEESSAHWLCERGNAFI